MYILGINAYHGDAAAALIKDGRIVAAVEEERFNRIKHCAGFPTESVKYCLGVAGIEIDAVDHVGISRDPSAHLHKKVLFAARRLSHRGTEAQRRTNKPGSGKQEAEGSRQETTTITEASDALLRGTSPTPGSPAGQPGWGGAVREGSNENGNGNRRSILRQIRDRLGNAAKVRDL